MRAGRKALDEVVVPAGMGQEDDAEGRQLLADVMRQLQGELLGQVQVDQHHLRTLGGNGRQIIGVGVIDVPHDEAAFFRQDRGQALAKNPIPMDDSDANR